MNLADIRESAWMAIDTVRTNKLRSALTILGVSVGVVTVVFMVSIIQGLNKAFAAQIESLGSNTIWATKFDPSIGHHPTKKKIHPKKLPSKTPMPSGLRRRRSSASHHFSVKLPRRSNIGEI